MQGGADWALGYQTALETARGQPDLDGATAFNHLTALGLVAGFTETEMLVGANFCLVGLDDIQETSQCYPKLGWVKCHVTRFDARSAEILLNWLGNDPRPEEPVRNPVELIQKNVKL